jgi:V8-like Glu-specific endopeptidase
VVRSGTGYSAATGVDAGTGFLIDPCHVLTSLHVVEPGEAAPPAGTAIGKPVTFAVGQTVSDRDRGALQGLKFLYHGRLEAHGQSRVVDGRVAAPENDWALIHLDEHVDAGIVPMTLAAPNLASLPERFRLSSAGFPSDRREHSRDGFKLKDLWKSDGVAVGVWPSTSGGALIATTLQITPGNSGGPVYGTLDGNPHVVIGIVQSTRGNGIDVTELKPNAQVLLTPDTLAQISAAQAQNPCP